MYLVNKFKRKNKAHLWDEVKEDTVCRMYSTGGLKQENHMTSYVNGDRDICSLCESVQRTIDQRTNRQNEMCR